MMNLKVMTPQGSVFDGEVEDLNLPSSVGYIGILPGHCSLVAELGNGTLRIREKNSKERRFFLDSGYVKVDPSGEVVVLSEVIQEDIELKIDDLKLILEAKRNEYDQEVDQLKKYDIYIEISKLEKKVEVIKG